MVHFIDTCFCRGKRPSSLDGLFYHSRQDLLSRLMKRRDYLRVLVAPALYGKTSLALEYAESVFAFEEVFWMDGRSPCFLRDLDKGLISAPLLKQCGRGALLVLDDLPHLDAQRLGHFKDMITELLKAEWEVLVCAIPSNDYFDDMGLSVMRIESHDFLLPKTLIDAYRLPIERSQRPIDSFAKEERIADIFWSHDRGLDVLLDEVVNEDLPDQLMLAMFIVLVLRRGCFEDILVFLDAFDVSPFISHLAAYVHLGIDLYQSEFMARSFEIDLIAKRFLPLLPHMSSYSRFTAGNGLVARLADALLGSGDPQRACELISTMTTLDQRRRWFVERSERLIDYPCLLPAYKFCEGLRLSKDIFQSPLMIGHAERLIMLGDEEGAIVLARRVLKAQDARDDIRAQAALLLTMICTGNKRDQAFRLLKKIMYLEGIPEELEKCSRSASNKKRKYSEWMVCSVLELHLNDHIRMVLDYVGYCHTLSMRPRLISKLLLRVVDLILKEQSLRNCEQKFTVLADPVLKMAHEHIISIENTDSFSCQDALLIGKMEALRDLGMTETYDLLPLTMREKAHFFEVDLFSQKKEFEKERNIQQTIQRGKSHRRKTSSTSLNEGGSFAIPKISVQLFGGLVVKRDGRELDSALFSRQKLKVLLAMLIIDQGKEIPRDRLARILWPDSEPLSAQKNLHSTWSLLRKALKTSQGNCPYLKRTQFSYKLEEGLVISDVSEFKNLCKNVLLEAGDGTDWASVNSQLSNIYRGDLLPAELENEVIIKARDDYRSRLVDCYSMSAFRLYERGEYELAMWFSQKAIAHDLTREDAYLLLMKAQVALGQRTAALDTYFNCCKHLSEELGIYPGSSTKVLYQEIIMED